MPIKSGYAYRTVPTNSPLIVTASGKKRMVVQICEYMACHEDAVFTVNEIIVNDLVVRHVCDYHLDLTISKQAYVERIEAE